MPWSLRIKLWAMGAVLVLASIAAVVVQLIRTGQRLQETKSLKDTMRESDALQDRLAAGHAAGNDSPTGGVSNDPNDRANQRKNRS